MDFREKLSRGGVIRNGWISNGSLLTGTLFGQLGFDSVTVDLQHGLTDYRSMVESLSGLSNGTGVPIVRVEWNTPSHIQKALDAGAMGIICPMVNSGAEASDFVRSIYYPPQGERSVGPIRAAMLNDNYMEEANTEILAIPMIETPNAVKNIDEIIDTPGIDGVYVGPSDLSISHGFGAGVDRRESEILKIMSFIIRKVRDKGLFVGLHTTDPEYSLNAIEMGFNFVSLTSDVMLMTRGIKDIFSLLDDAGY